MQPRYQYGTLTRRKRSRGPDVWQWRWSENGSRLSMIIGTVERFSSRAAAMRAVDGFRLKVNSGNPQTKLHNFTVGALIGRYVAEEMPATVRSDTALSYRGILENWIRPQWGEMALQSIKTIPVENWLKSIPRSRNTRAHIRNMFHLLFNCAIRWDMTDKNPINLVRQSSKRASAPRFLTPAEFKKLLAELGEPYKTMALVAGCTGLRVSEIVGLQWGDLNWENLTMFVRRSIVSGKVYDTKTEASQKPLPLDPELAEILLRFRAQASYVTAWDFIFAGDSGKPRWQGTMLTDHIKPAAERAGIGKVGWHTFRHMFSSLLHEAGTGMAVQKELLRHADIQTTMNLYTQAVSSAKRAAVHEVAKVLLSA